jgi:hypothetical protein
MNTDCQSDRSRKIDCIYSHALIDLTVGDPSHDLTTCNIVIQCLNSGYNVRDLALHTRACGCCKQYDHVLRSTWYPLLIDEPKPYNANVPQVPAIKNIDKKIEETEIETNSKCDGENERKMIQGNDETIDDILDDEDADKNDNENDETIDDILDDENDNKNDNENDKDLNHKINNKDHSVVFSSQNETSMLFMLNEILAEMKAAKIRDLEKIKKQEQTISNHKHNVTELKARITELTKENKDLRERLKKQEQYTKEASSQNLTHIESLSKMMLTLSQQLVDTGAQVGQLNNHMMNNAPPPVQNYNQPLPVYNAPPPVQNYNQPLPVYNAPPPPVYNVPQPVQTTDTTNKPRKNKQVINATMLSIAQYIDGLILRQIPVWGNDMFLDPLHRDVLLKKLGNPCSPDYHYSVNHAITHYTMQKYSIHQNKRELHDNRTHNTHVNNINHPPNVQNLPPTNQTSIPCQFTTQELTQVVNYITSQTGEPVDLTNVMNHPAFSYAASCILQPTQQLLQPLPQQPTQQPTQQLLQQPTQQLLQQPTQPLTQQPTQQLPTANPQPHHYNDPSKWQRIMNGNKPQQ